MTRGAFRRALISVSDKASIIPLAELLARSGCEIIASGGTAKTLNKAGIKVTEIKSLTGSPEILGGRVKSLHPSIHAAILANLDDQSHQEDLASLGITPIDLVIVNLYPFEDAVKNKSEYQHIIEQIDVGGVSLLRASAKNHRFVSVISSINQYEYLTDRIQSGFSLDERRELAARAFALSRNYDAAIAGWLEDSITFVGQKYTDLRYGENPHQKATLYRHSNGDGIAWAEQLQGKAMSFNNYLDADAALRAVSDHRGPAVVIIKHTNPCGIAVAADLLTAYQNALRSDPISAYGGVVAANTCVTAKVAEEIMKTFTEVVVAPEFDEDALEIFRKSPNVRVLRAVTSNPEAKEFRAISGGFLVQEFDRYQSPGDKPSNWQLVSGTPATDEQMTDLEFAWRSIRSIRSNAILIARNKASIGIGAGQVNRLKSAELAVSMAGTDARGAVAASDAFFPFSDGLDVLIDAGITAIVQPGGSKRDSEVIAAAQKAGLTMYLTGARHFSHS